MSKCCECGTTGTAQKPLVSVAIPEAGTVGRAVCDACVKLPRYAPHVKGN